MSRQRAGYVYENDTVKEVYRASKGRLFPTPHGMSGNHKVPSPDMTIDDGSKLHCFEFKTTSTDRVTVEYDPDQLGEPTTTDDLSQLIYYTREFPRTCCAYVGVSFTNRQLLLLKFWIEETETKPLLESAVRTAPIDVSVTHKNNLSVRRPDTDDWPSAQKGDDIEYILETIGFEDA